MASCPLQTPDRSARRLAIYTASVVLALAVEGSAPGRAQDEQEDADAPRVGYYIKIPSPVTTDVFVRVRDMVTKTVHHATREGRRPVLVFEIRPGPNQYGQASDMAKFLSSPATAGATTVAFVPETITGHTVLMALACGEIMMHEDAQIGDAGHDETAIDSDVRSGYTVIAKRRRTVSEDLALGMLDPALEVWVVETNFGRDYVLSSRLEEVRDRATINSQQILIPAGEPGLFTGAEARELGIASYLPLDLASVAKRLGLPPDALREDPSTYDDWRPVRIDLKGPINARLVQQVQRTIEARIDQSDVNFICLWIDSAGGSPTDSANLAKYLAAMEPGARRTVAYVPSQARADAALVAMACDHLVMHRDAVIGGVGDINMRETQVEDTVRTLRELANEKSRSWSLFAAMIDPQLEAHRYERAEDGLVQYYCAEELAEQDSPDLWRQGPLVTIADEPLELSGTKAREFGVATELVDGFAALKGHYSLQDEPALAEPSWADQLIEALGSTSVATFLLIIGGAALIAELQMPGIGLGGVISALCFLVYFWAMFLGGTATWLEALMFVAGVVFLLLEVLVIPGFGIFGLTGGLLVLASLVLASQTFILPDNSYRFGVLRDSMVMVALAGVGTIAAALAMRRYLPHAPVISQMVLEPPQGAEQEGISRSEALADYEYLVGQSGKAISKLTPSGKARIGGQMFDVLTSGDAIDRGAEIVVVEARANRIVVRAVR